MITACPRAGFCICLLWDVGDAMCVNACDVLVEGDRPEEHFLKYFQFKAHVLNLKLAAITSSTHLNSSIVSLVSVPTNLCWMISSLGQKMKALALRSAFKDHSCPEASERSLSKRFCSACCQGLLKSTSLALACPPGLMPWESHEPRGPS